MAESQTRGGAGPTWTAGGGGGGGLGLRGSMASAPPPPTSPVDLDVWALIDTGGSCAIPQRGFYTEAFRGHRRYVAWASRHRSDAGGHDWTASFPIP